jgi:hypothetical protein
MRTLAYLDPGNSSILIQIIIGGVAALGVAITLSWRRLLRFLHIKQGPPTETTSKTDPA